MINITLSRKKFGLLLLIMGGILNLLTFINQAQVLTSSLLIILLLILPGFIILTSIYRVIPKRSIESFLTVVGLSLSLLILGGLFINTIGPSLGIVRPLSHLPLLITYDLFGAFFAGIALYRHHNMVFQLKPKLGLKKLDIGFISYGVVCLLLVLGGSQILNNGGSGAWVLLSIILLAAYVVIGVVLHRRLSATTLPIAVFLIALSLLLSYSLRSNYVLGWDINQEFNVFQLANTAKHWSIAANRGPYNACLSITILPTVLNSLTHISGEFLFKFVMQGIFALLPVAIYKITKLIFPSKDTRLAFLASAIFTAQTWFITQAPVLVRQEIALFFFGVMLLILLDRKSFYKPLGMIFGLMVILSHYSTAYVMLALFVIYMTLVFIFFRKHSRLFSVRILVFFLLLTFLWQYQTTRTAGNLTRTLDQTITTLPETFSSQGIGSSIAQISFSNPSLNTQQNVTNTFRAVTKQYQSRYGNLDQNTVGIQYKPNVILNLVNPSMPVIRGITASTLANLGRFSKIIMSDILPLAGIVMIAVMSMRAKKKDQLKNYSLLALASIILLVVMIVLPQLKVNYNLTRLWLQALIVFAPLVAFAGSRLVSKITRYHYLFMAALTSVFMLYSAGVIFYITNGVGQAMFTNKSSDFYMYNTTSGEVYAAIWLGANRSSSPVYADALASLKLSAYGDIIRTQTYVYPSTITLNSFIYASQANLRGVEFHKYKDGLLKFDYPKQYLQDTKDVVYANQNSHIFY